MDRLNEIAAHIFGLGEDAAKDGVMDGAAYEHYVGKLQAEVLKARIKMLEDEHASLYALLPDGNVDAFELIKRIQEHMANLSNEIDGIKAQEEEK